MKNRTYDKKIFRLMNILNQLNARGRVRTADLARDFATTKRTIQRDISLLLEAGFPLVMDGNDHRFMDGFSLRKISVSSEEKYLLTILYRLFSGIEGPLQQASKDLLNRILISPQQGAKEDVELTERKKIILERKIEDFSKELEVFCQDEPVVEAFQSATDQFFRELEEAALRIKKDAGIQVEIIRKLDHENHRLSGVIRIPRKHIPIPSKQLVFDPKEKFFDIDLVQYVPDAVFKYFRIQAKVDVNYKFFGPFIKPAKFTCFDDLMIQLGFPLKSKQVNYETAYGNEEFLITRLLILWEKRIDLPEEVLKDLPIRKLLASGDGKKAVLK